jgi:hypothetical protein
MQNIQLDGVYSFMDNIKNIKLGDLVKLVQNPHNKISQNAIGVYSLDMKKLGYVDGNKIPNKKINEKNLELEGEYKITKICLNKSNLQILISFEFNNNNIINLEEYINSFDIDQVDFKNDINKLKKYLIREGFNINNIIITFINENYINILIEIIVNNNIEKHYYYTITKKYYDENSLIYDEFHKYKLLKNNIFESLKIHRLEFYILKNYKIINKLFKNDTNNFNIKNISYDNNIIEENINKNNLCYNHDKKIYFYIDLYEDGLIEFNNELDYTNLHINKLIFSKKNIYYIYNKLQIKKIELYSNII